jgi:protein-S-isoprenylcysteine O-methyltransferase Ste14
MALLAVLLFGIAGTLRYLEGWAYLSLYFLCSLAITIYLARNDPGLLQRRTRGGPAAEKESRQKVIQVVASVVFVSAIVVPALDRRFSWSRVPIALVVAGDLLAVLGFAIIFLVFRENSFTSGVIEVAGEQTVIDTGPYALVRHPMYAGVLVMIAGTPLALGSFWALLTLVPIAGTIIWRLLEEEKFLASHLPGYSAYLAKTPHRLIPRVW